MRIRTITNRRHGAATIEFALVGIPLMFVLVCTFEIARGMWTYETLAHAAREGARYAAVHAQDCATAPNTCSTNIGTKNGNLLGIAQIVEGAGVGLNEGLLNVTVSVAGGATILATDGPQTLTAMLADTQSFSNWVIGTAPNQTVASGPGNDVIVTASIPFYSALAMLWPGAPGAGYVNFQLVNLAASSRERIQF